MKHRIKLPRAERSAPLRGGTFEIFGSPNVFEGAKPSEGEAGSGEGGPGEAVMKTIERAYGVVDAHMRQGESAARRMARRDYGPTAFAHDMQDAAARSVQFMAEVLDVWMKTGSAVMAPPPLGSSPPAPPPMPGAGPDVTSAARARVRIRVKADRPTALSIDLDDPSRPYDLQPLHGPGGALRPEKDASRDQICIEVADGLREGLYSGLAVDPLTNMPVGSVTLEVGSAARTMPGR